MTVRIVVVDDHVFYREGIRSMLSTLDAGIEVVGMAATGEEADALVASLAPDVVLMDVAMPGAGGLAATRRLLARQPALPVLMLTMADDETVFAALRSGARGYLLKQADVQDLVRAIHAVHRGDAIFSPDVVRRLQDHFRDRPAADRYPGLTDRESDILRLLTTEASTTQIAKELELSEKTVRNYIANVLTKLQVRDRTAAVAKIRETGQG